MKHRHGFTLLELLISMALLSMIMLMLSGAVGFGERAWKTSDQISQKTSQSVKSRRLLNHLIEQAEPFFISQPRQGKILAFSGKENQIDFYIRSPFAALPAGLYQTKLIINQGKLDIHLKEVSTNEPIVKTITFDRPLKHFRFIEQPQQGDQLTHNSWTVASHAPDLIRLDFSDSDQTETLALYTRPLLLPKRVYDEESF